MKTTHHSLRLVIVLVLASTICWAQSGSLNSEKTATAQNELLAKSNPSSTVPATAPTGKQKVVIITGARFTYPLVQKWIDDYNAINQEVQIVIEARGSSDPAKYDILIEAYEPDEDAKKKREYVYLARYAILPIANHKSAFAKTYASKGLNRELIKQLYFHDMYADKENEKVIKEPYTIYTRLQKAGSPIIFTKYFGYEQKDVKGKSIAGADEHLLKAILRDSTGVSYLPLSLIYDLTSKKPIDGLTVLPVDLNGNGKVGEDEKFYDNLLTVFQQLEDKTSKDINNVPMEHIHMSVDKVNGSPEAIEFLRWVIHNGQKDLHDFGYAKPEPSRFEPEKFEQFVSKRLK